MPTDTKFSFSVLIGGRPVPEYKQNEEYMIESNLFTPYSYKQEVRELVSGELEVQEWPVTPYEVQVFLLPKMPTSWFELFIDGVKVQKFILKGGQNRIIKGFYDDEGTKEFLFALPRFARDESDRVNEERKSDIGTIKVKRYDVNYAGKRPRSHKFSTDHFKQANKKDAFAKTLGKYTMSTTKKGKVLEEHTCRSSTGCEMVDHWHIGMFKGELSVYYHMGYTLAEKGIQLTSMDWGMH